MLQIWERYPMAGGERHHRRRDLRRGACRGPCLATKDLPAHVLLASVSFVPSLCCRRCRYAIPMQQ